MASPVLMFMVLSISSCYSIAYGGDENGFLVVPTSSFEPDEAAVCSNARVSLEQNHSSLWLPLAHRHGPCAPRNSRPSASASLAETLGRNRARSSYIMSIIKASRGGTGSSAQDDVEIPTHLGNFVDSLQYVVTVGLGTPAVQQIVLIDTASTLSWVQCKPECLNPGECPSQKDPLFDPSHSSTYNPVRCDSDACRSLATNGASNCTDNRQQCRFGIWYDDKRRTVGVYSSDRLTLTRHGDTVVNDFHFGCGQDHRSPASPSETYDVLLALGRQPISLVGQASSVYRGVFSYCLPAADRRSGFLALGVRRSAAASSGFVFTPLRPFSDVRLGYNVVDMTGIAVGGKRLDLRPSAFAGGMVIDSGTIVTTLQSTAYRALRAAFRSAMAAYPLLPHGPLDTCFNLTGHKNVAVPKIAMTFSGGDTINLNVPGGVLLDGCLAFEDSGADKCGVLGSVNQRNFEVLYDISNSKVGFRANAC